MSKLLFLRRVVLLCFFHAATRNCNAFVTNSVSGLRLWPLQRAAACSLTTLGHRQPASFSRPPTRTSDTLLQLAMNKALARPSSVKGGGGGGGKRVAIIGGGIAGLVCGNRLQQLGFEPFVFDTGKRAVGGRVSSRVLSVPTTDTKSEKDGPKRSGGLQYKVDHSSQFFTADDIRFLSVVEDLKAHGMVREWTGAVGEIFSKKFAPLPANVPKSRDESTESQQKLFVGVGGMDAVSKGLAKSLKCEIDCWVAKVTRLDNGQWRLFRDNAMRRALEPDFDYLVVAHNGKCAERLMRDAGVPSLHRLLKCKFGCGPPPRGLMQLSSLWVLVFAVEGSLNLDFEGAFIKDHPDLSWVADNTRKLRNSVAAPDGGAMHETWTVISSREYGTRNKVPQEAVPAAMDAQVLAELTAAFEQATGLAPGAIRPVAHRTQMWGAAVPMNTYSGGECVLDAEAAAGIAGDWLIDPSIQGAALSGIAMAEAIVKHKDGHSADVGLDLNPDQSMETVVSPACGAFPGVPLGDSTARVPFPARGGRGRGGGGAAGRGRGRGRGGRSGSQSPGSPRGEQAQTGGNRGGGSARGGRGRGRGMGRGHGGAQVGVVEAQPL